MSETKTPDWADEKAIWIGIKCGFDCLGNHEERAQRIVAAALRSERERCAGIARAEIEPGRYTNTEYDQGWVAGAASIEDRIRAGDQP